MSEHKPHADRSNGDASGHAPPAASVSATAPDWLEGLFMAIDAQDSARFAAYLTNDGVFRFGSAPAVQGREAVREAVAGFFTTIRALRHDLSRTWSSADAVFVEGTVTYTRHDDSTIALPFVDVFELRREKIAQYLIYMDVAPLYSGQA